MTNKLICFDKSGAALFYTDGYGVRYEYTFDKYKIICSEYIFVILYFINNVKGIHGDINLKKNYICDVIISLFKDNIDEKNKFVVKY
jgi:hypothetical protein